MSMAKALRSQNDLTGSWKADEAGNAEGTHWLRCQQFFVWSRSVNKHFGAGVVLGAAIIGAIWAGTHVFDSGAPGIRSHEGGYVVAYSVITSKTQAGESSEGGEIGSVFAIEFYPAYVVVRSKEGRGNVFFPERTKSLSWRLKSE
jgi:hypothetical protein